jgi:hypothetical protein
MGNLEKYQEILYKLSRNILRMIIPFIPGSMNGLASGKNMTKISVTFSKYLR